MIGNIFFSYKEIDSNGDLFKSWVELTGPIWEMIGSDTSDIPAMKRWLAFLEGGLLPIISLTSLHFFVKYEAVNTPKEVEGVDVIIESESVSEEIGEEDKSDNLQDVANRVWEKVSELREEGKLPKLQKKT
jgi:hypothetical protein